MQRRDDRDPGYDDWFDEPEPPTAGAGRSAHEVREDPDDVWVLPESPRPRRSRGRGRREVAIGAWVLTPTQMAIIAACAIALLLAILAAAGVFSSGGKATAPSVTHQRTTTPPKTSTKPTPPVKTPTAPAPTTTLQPGDTGADVKTLQRALKALGFSPGKPDGDYGPATKQAVEKFQTSKGLTSDGIVGPKTLLALQQMLSG